VRLHGRGRRRGREGVARRLRRVSSSGAGPARSCPAPAPRPPLPRPAVTGFPESPQGRIGPSPALTPTTAVRHRAHTPGRNDMAQNTHTQALSDAGVSIWLDDLSRERMDSGNLQELVDTRNVVGVTTNPSIFQSAISGRSEYDADIARLAGEGKDVDAIVEVLTTDDVRRAADLLAGVHTATHGVDGRVSIEADPRLAHSTEETSAQAEHLHGVVGRENLFVKIPATEAGLPAITATIAAGISVNVTLIFSVDRYRAVIDAYLAGLEQAAAA